MKKVLFSLSLVGALASFASESAIDAGAQIFGVLPITTSAQSVIVSVPWIAPGYSDSPISVSNIIKTANLDVGDTVRAYDNTKGLFNVWTLVENESGVKCWSGVTVVGTNGTSTTESSDLKTLERGDALILKRASKPSGSYTFYVYGQVSSSASAGPISIATGTPTTPAYTLIAPPYAVDSDLNDGTWSGLTYGGADCDRIYLVDDANSIGSKFAYYNATAGTWGRSRGKDWKSEAPVKAGCGAWYVSCGTNSSVSVTWPAK